VGGYDEDEWQLRCNASCVVLSLVPVLAWEGSVTDKERTKESATLFTGIVLSTNFLQKLKCGALYSAQIQVTSMEKWQPGLNKTNTVVYFEKTYSAYDNEGGFQCHGRVCPAYPDIEIGKKIKVWSFVTPLADTRTFSLCPRGHPFSPAFDEKVRSLLWEDKGPHFPLNG
jgi:hypothetical protein